MVDGRCPDWSSLFEFEFPSWRASIKAIKDAIAGNFTRNGGSSAPNKNGKAADPNNIDAGFNAVQRKASGTRYAQGGFTWLNDGAGPEAVVLPRGAQVISSGELARHGMPGQGNTTFNVTINEAGRNARELADELMREIERRTRR